MSDGQIGNAPEILSGEELAKLPDWRLQLLADVVNKYLGELLKSIQGHRINASEYGLLFQDEENLKYNKHDIYLISLNTEIQKRKLAGRWAPHDIARVHKLKKEHIIPESNNKNQQKNVRKPDVFDETEELPIKVLDNGVWRTWRLGDDGPNHSRKGKK